MAFRLFGNGRGGTKSSDPIRTGSRRGVTVQELPRPPAWREDARNLDHGTVVEGALLNALHAEICARAAEAGAGPYWPTMSLTGLQVRRADLPDWWHANGNVLLAAPDAKLEILQPFWGGPPTNAVFAVGRGVTLRGARFDRDDGFIAIGDQTELQFGAVGVTDRSTILIGERTAATFGAIIDARNGGSIITGPDGLWADGLYLATDDGHTIRDLATGERINLFGGRIIIERHVWFCTNVQVMGDARIGADTVVGLGSMVKNAVLPANSVCAGRPAKPVRMGTTWSRWDEP